MKREKQPQCYVIASPDQPMSEKMRKAVEAMQAAVDEMLEREAKLGNKVVIGDKHGNPRWVSPDILCANGERPSPPPGNPERKPLHSKPEET